ncbi:hypothetical protein D9613_006849 [Agrocybe pediades]|uniref:Uncharacterized protein n=1 Tax=Agrocybe pediades TaxID=84607 RepID=A0A8H4VKB1_9AGAR|nr:hypothetical protein D9613_006849 [Agrocybe pediades]
MTTIFKRLPVHTPLAQFFSRHDDPLVRGFITRLDRSSIQRKRVAFAKAFVLNVFIVAAMAVITYMAMVRDVLSGMPTSLKLAACLTQDSLIAFAIYILLRSTTIPFLFGECRLRLMHGFRETEIIIRKLPSAYRNTEKPIPEDQRLKRYWVMASRAVDPDLLYCNAGAMLSPEYWTIEYAAVFDALRSISMTEIKEDDFEFAVWRRDNENWTVCELWRLDEVMTEHEEIDMFKNFLLPSGRSDLSGISQEKLPFLPSFKS